MSAQCVCVCHKKRRGSVMLENLRMNCVTHTQRLLHTHTQDRCWQCREANALATGGIVASGWLKRGAGVGLKMDERPMML